MQEKQRKVRKEIDGGVFEEAEELDLKDCKKVDQTKIKRIDETRSQNNQWMAMVVFRRIIYIKNKRIDQVEVFKNSKKIEEGQLRKRR